MKIGTLVQSIVCWQSRAGEAESDAEGHWSDAAMMWRWTVYFSLHILTKSTPELQTMEFAKSWIAISWASPACEDIRFSCRFVFITFFLTISWCQLTIPDDTHNIINDRVFNWLMTTSDFWSTSLSFTLKTILATFHKQQLLISLVSKMIKLSTWLVQDGWFKINIYTMFNHLPQLLYGTHKNNTKSFVWL